jgi:hypothetical protein
MFAFEAHTTPFPVDYFALLLRARPQLLECHRYEGDAVRDRGMTAWLTAKK